MLVALVCSGAFFLAHLHEDAIQTSGHTSARNGGDQVAQAAGGDAAVRQRLPGGLLQGMRDICYLFTMATESMPKDIQNGR